MRFWEHKTVWLSGATGSWGKEFCKQLLQLPIRKLLCFCHGEFRAYELAMAYRHDDRVRTHLGDIRDRLRVAESFKGADLAIHAAALKRIEAMTYSPFEVFDVNVNGTKVVIDTVLSQRCTRAFYVSSDKATLPTTFYGATKFIAEQLWIGANVYSPQPYPPYFLAARFGNALGSTGSVLSVWQGEMAQGKPLTITDPEMTRFLITLPRAVAFALDVLAFGHTGEVQFPVMPAATVGDLARALAGEDYPWNVVGPRGFGEKPHEILQVGFPTSEEAERLDIPRIRVLLVEAGFLREGL